MGDSNDTFPRRSLPGESEEWGREVQRRLRAAERNLSNLSTNLTGTRGAVKGAQTQVAGQAGAISVATARPNIPANVEVTSNVARWTSANDSVALVRVEWDATTTDTNGGATSVSSYEVWTAVGNAELAVATSVEGLSAVVELPANAVVQIAVRARGENGIWSSQSLPIQLTTASAPSATPKAPVGLNVLSSQAQFQPNGTVVATATLGWTAVTQTTDGDPLVVEVYEVTLAGVGTLQVDGGVAQLVVQVVPGVASEATVRAISTLGVPGLQSAPLTIPPVLPPVIAAAPSSPVLTPGMGGVGYRWNGQTSTGGAMPSGFGQVLVDTASSSSGPWASRAASLSSAGGSSVAASAGTTVYVRFRAVDVLGRAMGTSATQSATALGILIGDISPDLTAEIFSEQLEEYVVTASDSTPPGPGAAWSDDTPDWGPGEYVWRRTKKTQLDGSVTYTPPVMITGADGLPGEDAILLRIASSRGTSFKNNAISTVLTVTVFKGAQQITNITDLHAEFGASAFIEWWWRRMDDSDFGVISSADPRLSQAGFALSVSPADVDGQTVFQAILNT